MVKLSRTQRKNRGRKLKKLDTAPDAQPTEPQAEKASPSATPAPKKKPTKPTKEKKSTATGKATPAAAAVQAPAASPATGPNLGEDYSSEADVEEVDLDAFLQSFVPPAPKKDDSDSSEDFSADLVDGSDSDFNSDDESDCASEASYETDDEDDEFEPPQPKAKAEQPKQKGTTVTKRMKELRKEAAARRNHVRDQALAKRNLTIATAGAKRKHSRSTQGTSAIDYNLSNAHRRTVKSFTAAYTWTEPHHVVKDLMDEHYGMREVKASSVTQNANHVSAMLVVIYCDFDTIEPRLRKNIACITEGAPRLADGTVNMVAAKSAPVPWARLLEEVLLNSTDLVGWYAKEYKKVEYDNASTRLKLIDGLTTTLYGMQKKITQQNQKQRSEVEIVRSSHVLRQIDFSRAPASDGQHRAPREARSCLRAQGHGCDIGQAQHPREHERRDALVRVS